MEWIWNWAWVNMLWCDDSTVLFLMINNNHRRSHSKMQKWSFNIMADDYGSRRTDALDVKWFLFQFSHGKTRSGSLAPIRPSYVWRENSGERWTEHYPMISVQLSECAHAISMSCINSEFRFGKNIFELIKQDRKNKCSMKICIEWERKQYQQKADCPPHPKLINFYLIIRFMQSLAFFTSNKYYRINLLLLPSLVRSAAWPTVTIHYSLVHWCFLRCVVYVSPLFLS